MDSVLVRVDNCFVHGQVLEARLTPMRVPCLVGANDEVAGDFFCDSVIRLSVPRQVNLVVTAVEELPGFAGGGCLLAWRRARRSRRIVSCTGPRSGRRYGQAVSSAPSSLPQRRRSPAGMTEAVARRANRRP